MTREEIIGYAKLSMQSIELDNDKDTVAYEFYESVISILQTEQVPFDFELFQAGLMDIPEGMTNGDIIKAVFPNIEFTNMAFTVHATTKVTSNGVKGGISYDFWKDWWNAPYKKEVEE